MLAAARAFDGVHDGLARDARDGHLAGGEHVGDEQDVRLVEGVRPLLLERLRARVAVRLEDAHDASEVEEAVSQYDAVEADVAKEMDR